MIILSKARTEVWAAEDVAQDAYCSERSWVPSAAKILYDGAFKASRAAWASSETSNGTRRDVIRAIMEDGKDGGRLCAGEATALDSGHVEYALHVIETYPDLESLGHSGTRFEISEFLRRWDQPGLYYEQETFSINLTRSAWYVKERIIQQIAKRRVTVTRGLQQTDRHDTANTQSDQESSKVHF